MMTQMSYLCELFLLKSLQLFLPGPGQCEYAGAGVSHSNGIGNYAV